ncbi:MAG: TrkA family potassium uptake protein [bacterium]
MERHVIRIVFLLVSLAIALTTIGWVGFIVTDGLSAGEALSQTINILSSVGLGNPNVKTTAGKVLIGFLQLGAIGIVTVAVAALSQAVLLGTFKQYLGRYRMDDRIKKLNNHFIIAGYSLTGQSIASDLANENQQFVIIEKNHDIITGLEEKGLLYVEGDATDEEVLKKACVERCRALFAVLSSDSDNLMLVLSARGLNEKIKIVSRMTREEFRVRFLRAGADSVMSPQEWASLRMVQSVLRPHLLELLSRILDPAVSNAYIDEAVVTPDCPFLGKSLANSGIRQATGIVILGIKKNNGELLASPGPEEKINEGDVLLGFGQRESFVKLKSILGGK